MVSGSDRWDSGRAPVFARTEWLERRRERQREAADLAIVQPVCRLGFQLESRLEIRLERADCGTGHDGASLTGKHDRDEPGSRKRPRGSRLVKSNPIATTGEGKHG